jgi:hypothetical protein
MCCQISYGYYFKLIFPKKFGVYFQYRFVEYLRKVICAYAIIKVRVLNLELFTLIKNVSIPADNF